MSVDTVDASAMTEHSNLPFDSFESIRDFIGFHSPTIVARRVHLLCLPLLLSNTTLAKNIGFSYHYGLLELRTELLRLLLFETPWFGFKPPVSLS